MSSQLNTASILSNGNGIYALFGGVTVASGYAIWARYNSNLTTPEVSRKFKNRFSIRNDKKQDNFKRTLEILGKGQVPMRNIQAKIDTAADYSLLSKFVIKELDLPILPLTDDDPVHLLLPDSGNFPLAGKVSVRFHGINPKGAHLVFRFGNYENVATFYVPKDTDISCFDTYIGADNIHKLQLQKRNFFAFHGLTSTKKTKEKSDLEQAMAAYDGLVNDWRRRREYARTDTLNFTEPAPVLTDRLQNTLTAESRTSPSSGSNFTAEDYTWAENYTDKTKKKAKKEKRDKLKSMFNPFKKDRDDGGDGTGSAPVETY